MAAIRKVGLITLLIGVVFSAGCTSSMSFVSPLGDDKFMIQSNFDPRSIASKQSAEIIMKRRAEVACDGSYLIDHETLLPDPYWGDFLIMWEVSCRSELVGYRF